MRELARSRTTQAIEALTAALNNPRERVAAAIALLDRGWGKATQLIAGDEERPAVIEFRWAPASEPEPVVAAVIDAAASIIDDTRPNTNAPLILAWEAPESGPPESC
jgi:hypothetical protein